MGKDNNIPNPSNFTLNLEFNGIKKNDEDNIKQYLEKLFENLQKTNKRLAKKNFKLGNFFKIYMSMKKNLMKRYCLGKSGNSKIKGSMK